MKKLMLLAAIMLACQAYAQDYSQSKSSVSSTDESATPLHITPAVGAAVMSIKSDSGGSDPDTGVSIGGLVDIGRGITTFQTGLLYNQFGGKGTETVNGTDLNIKVNLSYLSVPALAKFNFSGDPESTFFIKAGLMPGLLVSKQGTVSAGGQSVSTSDVSVNSFDLPAVAGLGGAIPISPTTSFIIEASYIRSLLNISSSGSGNARNEGVLLTAGVSLSL